MSRTLALMAVREPVAWQQPSTGVHCAFFPGALKQWPLLGATPVQTIHALHRMGAIERTNAEGQGIWHMRPSRAGRLALSPEVVATAREWNEARNANYARKN